MKIATIVNYCTKDYRFLFPCLKEVAAFSEQLIIPVCDHFFNGIPENQELLQRSYEEHPYCLFVEYAYDPKLPYGMYCPFTPEDDDWAHYWHSTSRYVGYHFLKPEIDYVLFLDIDEIIESKRFIEWLQNFPVSSYSALRFLSYFYFREPQFRAKSFSLNALLIKKEALPSPEVLLSIYERKGVFDKMCGKKISSVAGLDDKPLVHHYSWVRKEEELYFKASCWGHCKEKDWQSLLKEEFSQEFRGRDCLYGLEYETVEALHDPFKEPILPRSKNEPIRATPQKLLKLQTDALLK